MKNPDKLRDSSLNGVTAFDDENGKRITAVRVLDFVKMYSPESFRKVYTNVCSHLNEIEELVQGIPCTFNDIEVISDNRKRYYKETFKIRLNLLGTYC